MQFVRAHLDTSYSDDALWLLEFREKDWSCALSSSCGEGVLSPLLLSMFPGFPVPRFDEGERVDGSDGFI